jgi:serine/threonine protein phosphatase PrpC
MSDVSALAPGTLRAAFRSDPGRVRTNNEDVPLVDADRGVYGVIDGVGGHAAGEVAAALACDVILQRLGRPLGTPAERVREAIAIANNEIFRRAEESPELHGMTCVVTLAVVTDGSLTIGHVGDSRLYKLRADGIRKLTHDHSPVGEREDAREITEVEAMRHPRRNEVFRDVGSGYRDKDEADYVEVIEEPMERDCAILMCTDGLTDMVPSPIIERLVRQHAGDPDAVAEALVAAANDAGGKDNVTVVYAEAPDFARAVNGTTYSAAVAPAAPAVRKASNPVARAARWVVRSRTTWFAVGAVIGVLAALGMVWRMADAESPGSRTLIVGAEGTGQFARISDAVAAARIGDLVQVEPGVYPEQVFLPPGVSLGARVPGSVTLARPEGVAGEWIALRTFGDEAGRVAGIRFESTAALPIDVGLRVAGSGWTIELVELDGPMRAGVEVVPGGSALVQGSQISVQGTGILMVGGSHATLAGNVFLRQGRAASAAVAVTEPSQVQLRRNVFAGYGTDPVRGLTAAQRKQLLSGNVVVAAEPTVVR